MRPPYGEPHVEPGRGGDGADSPQYKSRRLIVEMLKREHPRSRGLSDRDLWYDREVAPIVWLNRRITEQGHRWCVRIVDMEYEFSDVI